MKFRIPASKVIFVLAALVSFLIVANLVLGTITLNKTNAQARDNRAFTQCVSQWANASAARSSVLTKLSLEKSDALDQFLRTFSAALTNPAKTPAAQAKVKKTATQELQHYVRASNAYNKALKDHPLPKSPKFACANVK